MVIYEWIVEEIDEYDDIIEVLHRDNRKEAEALAAKGPQHGGVRMTIGLVRDVGNDIEGLIDRSWAYIQPDGKLPVTFNYGADEEGPIVPKRFR